MRCADIMKTNAECLSEREDARTAARKMRDGNLGFLPVCDEDGRVVGTVTDRDLAIRLVAENMPGSTGVADVMSREIVSCSPDDDVEKAERIMAREKKSRMLVVDASGKLLGVFSLSDIAQHETEPSRAAATLREITRREARVPGA